MNQYDAQKAYNNAASSTVAQGNPFAQIGGIAVGQIAQRYEPRGPVADVLKTEGKITVDQLEAILPSITPGVDVVAVLRLLLRVEIERMKGNV